MHMFDMQQNISTPIENLPTLNEEISPWLREVASFLTVSPDYQKKFLFTTSGTWLFGSNFASAAILLVKTTNLTIQRSSLWWYSRRFLLTRWHRKSAHDLRISSKWCSFACTDIFARIQEKLSTFSVRFNLTISRTEYIEKVLDFLVIFQKS